MVSEKQKIRELNRRVTELQREAEIFDSTGIRIRKGIKVLKALRKSLSRHLK